MVNMEKVDLIMLKNFSSVVSWPPLKDEIIYDKVSETKRATRPYLIDFFKRRADI